MCPIQEKLTWRRNSQHTSRTRSLQAQPSSYSVVTYWVPHSRAHFDKLRSVAFFTLKSDFFVSLKQDFPQIVGAAIITQALRRMTTVLLFHSYLSCHLPPPSSLVPFLSPWCTVPRYLGNSADMFCSPFSQHSLALEGRCTLLVLLSSTPKKPMWTAPSNPRLTFTLPETTADIQNTK